MSASESRYRTRTFESSDAATGFRCGKHSLDDFFKRHAAKNDALGVGRTFVLTRDLDRTDPPVVLGYYTLSMALVSSDDVTSQLGPGLPRYPLPVALIGRLAVDERARGKRLGEALLVDALARIVDASALVGCVGVVVDALDSDAAGFYAAYDFEPIHRGDDWPRRMFQSIATARVAFEG